MKKKIFLFIALATFLVITPVSANEITNFYSDANENVSFNENVEGDSALAGNVVDVLGNIDGIGFMAGNTVNIDGSMEYGFAAGNEINITGHVTKNLYLAGSEINFANNSSIGRDLKIIGQNINLAGKLERHIDITGTKIIVKENTMIYGNINLNANNITIEDNVTIHGTLSYNENANANISDNAMITQEDYMRYEEYISSLVDVGDSKIVYISGLEDHNYEPIKGAKTDNIVEILKNGGSISESVYFRDGDTYKQMNFTLDAKNGIRQGVISDVKDLSDITVEINSHGFLGNPEEYIRMLRIQGKEELANQKQREYEYFMNNREKIPELLQKGYDTREFDELAEALYNGEFVGEPIDIDFSEFEKGTIEYKGISISDDGLIYGVNEYGEITREVVSEEVISEIEESVKRGEISLNEEQRQTLLNAKQNIKQDEKIGQEEFKKVAESSIEEKEQTFRDLRMATQEREQEERNYNEQGE